MVDRLRELRYDRGHPAQNVRVYTDEEDDLRVGTPSDLVQAFAHKYENLGLAQDAWLDVTAVPRPPLTPKHCAACVRGQQRLRVFQHGRQDDRENTTSDGQKTSSVSESFG